MKTRSLICAAFLVVGLCAFAPATAQAQLGAWPSMASKRPTALFAGKDFDTVGEFFMRKDAAALRALVRRGLDPNETVDGTSLPLFVSLPIGPRESRFWARPVMTSTPSATWTA